MWRAVFAFSLVDNILSIEEQQLLVAYLKAVPFSDIQLEILKEDFIHPQNVEYLYRQITEQRHKERFCILARALVWCEGDIIRQEEIILKRLSCLGHGVDKDILNLSRHHPHIRTYYQNYARAGLAGVMKTRPAIQIRA